MLKKIESGLWEHQSSLKVSQSFTRHGWKIVSRSGSYALYEKTGIQKRFWLNWQNLKLAK